MAVIGQPEASSGVLNAIKGALGLFDSTNKAQGVGEDINPKPIEEYESSMSDVEIIELTTQWKWAYRAYYQPIEETQKLSFDYWIGKHRIEGESQLQSSTGKTNANIVDNLLFEAIETFLPIATRANPEPLVTSDPSELGQRLAKDVQIALIHEADTQKLRRKLAKGVRQWVIRRIGVWKISWDPITKSIRTDVINPMRMGFDPDGFMDEGGIFKGEWLFEKKKHTADKLAEMFPKKKEFIIKAAQGKMGTKLEYYEWWYCGTDVFYTLGNHVLGKYKNPNWNYDGEMEDIDRETGEPVKSFIQGTNHLKEPTAPYVFLSVFSTGQQPHDETSLILQNISNQDRVNRRNAQIDKNVDSMNNGMVVSGRSFTEEQASQAAAALRRGIAIRVPDGDVNTAVSRFPAPPLPKDIFVDRDDARNELRNIFGTSGSTPQGTEQQDTVRGKIMVNQMDTSRIGGGVTEWIEQIADTIYNMWVQFMFVYYDEEHYIISAGVNGGTELITLKNDRFPFVKSLSITVKEGSLIPKDPLTQRNEAIDLWSANAIDPLSFYKKLDFPDPAQATQQLILWQMLQKGQIQPQMYLPSFQIAGAGGGLPTQQIGTGGPAVSPPPTTPPPEGSPAPSAGTPEAIASQSQQLLGAIPIR